MSNWNTRPDWQEFYSYACDDKKLKLRKDLTSEEAERIVAHAAGIEEMRVSGFTPDDQRRYKNLFEMDHEQMYWNRLSVKDRETEGQAARA
jgi:hypothetical protein